jgi:hypothetical protein
MYSIIKTSKLYPIILLVLVLALVACSSDAPPSPTATATPYIFPTIGNTNPNLAQEWEYRWLKGIPCKPPCFEGVTPGVTTKLEAVEVLKQSPIVDPNSFNLTPYSGTRAFDTFGWGWKQSSKKRGYLAFSTTPDYKVILIRPELGRYKLTDIFKAYGEPSHVNAFHQYTSGNAPQVYFVKFVYLSQGFLIEQRTGDKYPELTSDMEVENPEFFVPDAKGYDAFRSPGSYGLVAWEGFKSFLFYCRDVDSPCVNKK